MQKICKVCKSVMKPEMYSEPPYFYCGNCGNVEDMTSSEVLGLD